MPPGQIAVSDLLEPGRRDHFGELALARKAADAFDEIGIGVAVAGDDLPEQRHDMKAVEIVERLQQRRHFGGEFEAHEPSARLQHPPRLGERRLDMGHVAQAEGDRIEIEAALGEGQPLGVGAQPLDAVEDALVERAGAADLEHTLVGVADDGAALDGRLRRERGAATRAARCRRCRRRRRSAAGPVAASARPPSRPSTADGCRRSSDRSSDRSAARRCRRRRAPAAPFPPRRHGDSRARRCRLSLPRSSGRKIPPSSRARHAAAGGRGKPSVECPNCPKSKPSGAAWR